LRGIYNFIFTSWLFLTAPLQLWRLWRSGLRREGFQERFGRYGSRLKQGITNRQVIWLHVSRASGINLCIQLVGSIESQEPNLTVVVSASTPSRMGVLKRKLPSRIARVYSPVDRRRWVQRAFAVLAPRAVVLIGMDVGPNFLWHARRRGVPVFLVSSQPDQQSPGWHRLLPAVSRTLFASLAGVACESEGDGLVLRSLGCDEGAVRVVGKFTRGATELDGDRVDRGPEWLGQLGIPAEARLLVGGHTHRGEEGILAEACMRLRPRFPGLFLVVVPRHRERAAEAGQEIGARGLRCVFRTDITPDRPCQAPSVQCLVVNTRGELQHFYERASVVFVGKSLRAEGGHSPLEPALMGKPILFGPNMQDHQDIAQKLLLRRGAFQVANGSELEETLARLLEDENLAQETGRAARQLAQEQFGWIKHVTDMVLEQPVKRGVHVARA
jgi:3-deoxy-D-manno-octulosonic-acid transferase